MAHFSYITLLILFIISAFSINTCYAIDNPILADSTATADSTTSVGIFHDSFDNQQIYEFKKLINTNFNGFVDALKNNGNFQIFNFVELGRPRYIAPINMYPQQATIYFDGVRANDYINGMFNTRFLSLDRVGSIRTTQADSSALQAVNVAPMFYVTSRNVIYDDAYTRLKYYEGDYNYTDLDIHFAKKYNENTTLKLAGFNKGYDGTVFNNGHTSVNYHANLEYKINPATKAFFNFYLNHERSGMANGGTFRDYTYGGDDRSYAVKFIFDVDTTFGNQVDVGLISKTSTHFNRSKVDTFYVEDNSDDYTLYLSKSFRKGLHNFITRFSIDNHRIWGTAFNTDFSDTRFSLNLSDKIKLGENSHFRAVANIEQLNDFNPHVNAEVNWQSRYGNFISGLNASIYQRYPTPLEREYDFKKYSGNANLEAEKITQFSLTQYWLPYDYFMIKGRLGYNQVDKEITFKNDTFVNGSNRSWFYFEGESQLKVWDFKLSVGGHALSAKKYISPKNMLWGQLVYHGIWFNKTIVIDASANMNWYSRHDKIFYNPIVQRFYTGSGENASYTAFSFKLVGTVGNAEIFLEMDNLLKSEIKYIEGYYNSLRYVRFGVNWVLWK